ncbi:MAG: 50S ribosomal protein L25/general stress protein Ctc [Bacteroidales bacterium]|nr:50S ribosomal protein L25/general stress protein Ctc [Bacteroidales bacterium]
MKTLEIIGSQRKELGKKDAAKIRKANNVPCVLYGGSGNIHFSTHENSFLKLVYTDDVHLVNLNIDGKTFKSILKDIQFHPVNDKIIHADFIELHEERPVTIALPVKVTGDSEGVKAGGKLKIGKRYLRVKGLIKDLPEHITIDITNLNIHDSVKAGEIKLDNVTIMEPERLMVVNIATSRVAQKAEETGAEGEAASEEGAPAGEAAEEAK